MAKLYRAARTFDIGGHQRNKGKRVPEWAMAWLVHARSRQRLDSCRRYLYSGTMIRGQPSDVWPLLESSKPEKCSRRGGIDAGQGVGRRFAVKAATAGLMKKILSVTCYDR